MALEGIGAQPMAAQQQMSLMSDAPEAAQEEGGSVQQKAQVSVLKDSMEQAESQTMQLIDSAMGVGQNVDMVA
jgi:hypothetical protein